MLKNKYYSLKNILNKNCYYNVIFGERSNGKTYACLKYGIEQFLKTGGQIGIIRRWKEDFKIARARELFSALIVNGEVEKLSKGKYNNIGFKSGVWFLYNNDDVKDGKVKVENQKIFAYAFALSDMEHNKSISYPRITNIIFDEFISSGVYLVNEFTLFLNTLSTIIRDRDNVKIFMLGNTVNKYCLYFSEMGLTNITKMEQGTIDVYTYSNNKLQVAVEYCNSLAKTKKSNFYFAFNNPNLEMITHGKWELGTYPHLPRKYNPSEIEYIFFIDFDNNIYQCEIICGESDEFIYIHEKTTNVKNSDDLIYSIVNNSSIYYNNNIYYPRTKVERKIISYFKSNKVFFQNNSVGNAVENFLKICRGGLK